MIGIIMRAASSLAITLASCAPRLPHLTRSVSGSIILAVARWRSPTAGKLCGRIVWVKDPAHSEGCNFQVIGDVKPIAGNKWDGGWIIDPDKDPNKKYDVEITPLSDQKLKVLGYMGTKFLSETMTWTRAPDLKKRRGTCKGP